jgi:hypothetical protein
MPPEQNIHKSLAGKVRRMSNKTRASPTKSEYPTKLGSAAKEAETQLSTAQKRCAYRSVKEESSDLPRVTEYWASEMEL